MSTEFLERQRRLGWQVDISAVERLLGEEISECYRLYLLGLPGGIVITISCHFPASTCEVAPMLRPDRQALPAEWRGLLGKRPFADIDCFRGELEALDVWHLPDCLTNSRDGYFFHHVAGKRGMIRTISGSNPDLHTDSRYQKLVNLYSQRCLKGLLSS